MTAFAVAEPVPAVRQGVPAAQAGVRPQAAEFALFRFTFAGPMELL